jgi:uncharacterized protein
MCLTLLVNEAYADPEQCAQRVSEQNWVSAFGPCTDAALRGDPQSQYNLATMYDYGNGTPSDKEQALRWYLTAIDNGSPEALYALGLAYGNGNGVVEANPDEMVRLLLLAAEKGVTDALVVLGNHFMLKAIRISPEAQFGLSVDTRAHDLAYELFSLAASQGNDQAMFEIGYMYFNGYGVEENVRMAFHHLTNSGNLGNFQAQWYLADIFFGVYLSGSGEEFTNYQEAAIWYRRAAKEGLPPRERLGEMYERGLGVPQDYVEAHMWYNVAAASGSDEAALNREELSRMMSASQIQSAQERATRCINSNYSDC